MNLLLIGCGNIGGSLLELWAKSEIFTRIVVIQPSKSAAGRYSQNTQIEFIEHITDIPTNFTADLTVLTMKPQQLDQILPNLLRSRHNRLIVSLLAGVQINKLVSGMPSKAKIIRIMPNMAIKTGKSLNLAYAAEKLSTEERNNIENIFDSSGLLVWLDQEYLLDMLTPITSSGLAYFFLLAEILVAETVKLGIEQVQARDLVQQVFIGSASLVEQQNDFTTLMNQVASKKGVTEVALGIINPKLQPIITEALGAALNRIKELANENSC